MLKVLNVITNGINSNGIASSWYELCKELHHSDYKSDIQMNFTYSLDNSNIETIKNFEKLGINTIQTPSRLKHTIRYINTLRLILKRDKYDIIHVNGSSSLMVIELLAGYLSGVKVRIAHSRNTICLHKNLHHILKAPFKWLANGKLACGYDAGKWLFDNDSFKVLHNGKDFSRFHYSQEIRSHVREELNLDHKLVIGHVGRFNEQKNHSFLIDIFKCISDINPNAMLMLIGDGMLFEEIKIKVKELGLSHKVIFTGAITDVHNKLQAIDVIVFPSLYEGLPNVVLEWQAMGIPSIISDTITKECAVTNLVYFENLLNKPEVWANRVFQILKKSGDRRESNAKEALINLSKSGYNIKDSLVELIDFYNKCINLQSKVE